MKMDMFFRTFLVLKVLFLMHLFHALGYVHTGPVPNGSDPKIVPDRPFVHTGPANRTVNPFPIRSENWTSKKAGPEINVTLSIKTT